MSPIVTKYLLNDPIITPEDQQKWYMRIKESTESIYWMASVDGVDIGYASIDRINHVNMSADPGMYIAEQEYRGIGLGRSIILNIQKYAFEQLNLNKLYGPILSPNYPALISYLRSGWKIEGVLREHCLKYDQFHDVIMIAILKRDWLEMKAKMEYAIGEFEE